MAITAMAMVLLKINKRSLGIIIGFFLSFPVISFARTSEFTPKITLEETLSDNVELTTADTTSSLVSQLGLALEEKYLSKNASLNFTSHSVYVMYSHDNDINDVFHSGDINGSIGLGPKGLDIIASANLSNLAANSAENALADIVSGDTVQSLTYSAGLRYKVQNSNHVLSIASTFDETKSEDGVGESNGVSNSINSQNGTGANDFFWNLDARQENLSNNGIARNSLVTEAKIGLLSSYKFNPFIRYYNEDYTGSDQADGISSNSYGLGFRWQANQSFYLDLSYNKSQDENLDADGEPFEDYIDTSFKWTPTSRTDVEAHFSQRFYGNSYGLELTHKNRRLTNRISYSEDVEAFTRDNYVQQEAGFYWCPNNDDASAQDCALFNNQDINLANSNLIPLSELVLVEDNEFSLNKRLSWVSTLQLPRTSFTLTVSTNNREDLSDQTKNKDRMASLLAKRELTPRSSISMQASLTKTIIDIANDTSAQEDQYIRFNIDYTKDINKNFDVALGLSKLERESTTRQFNYNEHRVYLRANKGF